MSSTDLLFGQSPNAPGGPVEIVFGDDDDATGGAVELRASGRITGLRGHVVVRRAVQVRAAGTITGLRGHIGARYDINVDRSMVGVVRQGWQDAQRRSVPTQGRYEQAQPLQHLVQAVWQDASALQQLVQARWQDAQRLATLTAQGWQDARRLATAPVLQAWQEAQRLRRSTVQGFEQGRRMSASTQQRYQEAIRLRNSTVQGFEQGRTLGRPWLSTMGHARPISVLWACRYEEAGPARPGITVITPPQPDPCYVPELPAHLVFDDAADASQPVHLVFVCDRHAPGPEPGATVVIPIKRYYVTFNDIILRRVDGDIELRAYGFTMSIDADSWTWSWSATLRRETLPYLEPDSAGLVELEAVVNGVPYRLAVEKIGRDSQFGSVRIRVSGRGLAAVLASPSAPTLNFGNTVPRTAQQLMADVLTVNGVPMGWGVEFGLTDWLVPADAWTLQGSHMDAITDIAAAVGGYVQPHATDKTLRILPRYPAAPWAWGTITPDVELPAAAASVESIEWLDRPAYNRVFVGGVSQGVFGPFKRAGTAGDVLAPPVTHALITHADAHRQRGIAEISNTGRQAHYELKTMVHEATGLILPGQFVRYVGDSTVIGIVRSTRLDWSRPMMHQTIGVETHVA